MSGNSLRAAFESQSRACLQLGSPFNARLCALLAERLAPGTPLTDRLIDWPGDVGPNGASLPLRLCGALHRLARAGDPPLTRVYPPADPSEDQLWSAVAIALRDRAEEIGAILDNPPQTNEVRRSAVLIAAGHWLAARTGLPIRLHEVGASAGLNLLWDSYALAGPDWRRGPDDPALVLRPDWTGPPPPDATLRLAGRRGVDLSPVDPLQDAERLMSYVWPDQPERLALTRDALALARDLRPQVDRGDAAAWLETVLAPREGEVQLVQHTIAWQYFPEATKARAAAAIDRAGAAATDAAPVARIGLESADDGDGAGITLTLWPGGRPLAMGRADFHGRWVRWSPPTD